MAHIVLYDFTTDINDNSTSASVNVLKTVFNLRYKRIPHTTERIELTDLEVTLKQLGAQPTNGPGGSRYTLPVIKDRETGQVISESFIIAKYLDEKYPEHKLVPTGTDEQQAAFVASLWPTIGVDAHYLGMHGAYMHTPSEASRSAYKARLLSAGLNPFPVADQSPERTREVLTAALNNLAGALDAQGGSKGYFIGDHLTFADVAAAAYVEWFLVSTKESQHILAANGGRWKKLLEDLKG